MKKFCAILGALAFCLSFAQADEIDDMFSDSGSTVIDEAKVVAEPEKAIMDTASFSWAGDFTGSAKFTEGYEKLQPTNEELRNPDDNFSFGVGTRISFDARPDRHYRVFGKFTADYPFKTAKIFELFSDFDWNEKLFFRFGKQTAGWGLSRFYQIADPLSVGVKDPSNPSADLEGPLALRISFPMGMNNFYVYGVLKDSYLPADLADARLTDAGAGIKGDFFLEVPKNKLIGNADLSVGAYYQRSLAPKGVVSLSTGIGKFQVFTDQVVSWGLDSYRLTDTALPSNPFAPVSLPVVYETEKNTKGFYYSATLGSMYVNNDWHFTGYAEYLFSASASNDGEYLDKYVTRYFAETAHSPGTTPTLTQGDMFGYLSRHNSAASFSWSELFGNNKLSASILWMQNWIDLSGIVTPSFTVKPFDHFSVETGVSVVWGKDKTEWVVKNTNPSSLVTRRLSGFIGVKIGGGKF